MKSASAMGAATLLAAGFGGWGCASEGGGPDGTGVKIQVAPLTLPGVTDVCYTLEVRNDIDETVWRQEHVCADQYGDLKSAITYIGTCDATDNDDSGTNDNTVTVTIEDIWDGNSDAVADDEWDNPCSFYADGTPVDPNGDGNGPCEQTVPCVENADTLVLFNLTIMRDANQGFFDVAVNFEDIFCSAKVDCQYPQQGPIQLLFNPNKGNTRDNTIVVGRACTSGVGDDTQLHTMPTMISCGLQTTSGGMYQGLVFAFDPTSGDGNQDQDNVDATWSGGAYTFVPPLPLEVIAWQNANYSGTEQLTEDGETSLGKIYLNQAIGFDFAALKAWWSTALVYENGTPLGPLAAYQLQGCSLVTAFSATDDAGFPAGGEGLSIYPVAASFDPAFSNVLKLWTAGSNDQPGGILQCSQNALDATGKGGLSTFYSDVDGLPGSLPLCMTSDGVGSPLTGCAF